MKAIKNCLEWLTLVCIPALVLSCSPGQEEIQSRVIDLASDTDWELSIDGGPWRIIKVPGGGYNSDLQDLPLIDQADVSEKASYRRSIYIPEHTGEHSVYLAFGAVNHGCEIYLDGQLVSEHIRPLMPFEVELTGLVHPGESHLLEVVTHPQWYYRYNVPHAFVYTEARNHPDSRPEFFSEAGWATKFARGITRYVELRFRPNIRIRDVFIQTSVSSDSLAVDLWIQNHTSEERNLLITPAFSAWNDLEWDYPDIIPAEIKMAAGEVKKVSLGLVKWGLGPDSYWWPNKPFREDYKAVLHHLDIRLSEKNRIIHKKKQRFGFVEWAEENHYYTVNGVRINMISDGTPEPAMSSYDCYTTSPAFLPPSDTTKGCPETWKRYMRLGICANRIHQSTPTEYMMDMADEIGFMLVAETPIRGCQEQTWDDPEPFIHSVMDMALYGRNHPSICRYSLLNEGTTEHIPGLIDAILSVDNSRPLVFEDNYINHPAVIKGSKGHAYAMLHYQEYPKPATMITGMGEYAWHWADREKYGPVPPGAEGGLEEFIYYAGDMRRWDIVYVAGWDFINYWPNFLEGMSQEQHAWKQSSYHKDREHEVDGWDSPVARLMQKYFHPHLVMDIGIHEMNGPDSDLSRWPEHTVICKPGELLERRLEVFNDGLAGNEFSLKWETRWDSATGPEVENGVVESLQIDPGFHRTVTIDFTVPQTKEAARDLFLILSLELEGEEVFAENAIHYTVTALPGLHSAH